MNRAIITAQTPLCLGSASPRRYQILSELRIPTQVCPPEVDEAQHADDTPERFLQRVVRDKMNAVLELSRDQPFAARLVADTIVVVDGRILGKPKDLADAERLLRRIRGRSHRVFTRYLVGTAEGVERARTVVTTVHVRQMTEQEVANYAATGEGLDKAGAYAVQGIGSCLVEAIEGSYTNVVGLPACEVVSDLVQLRLLEHFPFAPTDEPVRALDG